MSRFDVIREDRPEGGRYVVRIPGKPEAEMTFTMDGPVAPDGSRVMVIRHTLVPSELGGMGVGKALVEHMIGDVRTRGVKIMPLCSFTRGTLEKHPEWQDVLDDPF
jgi:predicted GNAT family acetyltransferase